MSLQLGIVAHEIGHALGFYHEQSRTDRDDYVVINLINIDDSKESNFRKAAIGEVNNHSVPYDYSSVMHYGSTVSGHALWFTVSNKQPGQYCSLLTVVFL